MTSSTTKLVWEGSFAIAKVLQALYPDEDLEDVSLEMIYEWTTKLPDFADDPELVTDEILLDIYQDWYEEILEGESE